MQSRSHQRGRECICIRLSICGCECVVKLGCCNLLYDTFVDTWVGQCPSVHLMVCVEIVRGGFHFTFHMRGIPLRLRLFSVELLWRGEGGEMDE